MFTVIAVFLGMALIGHAKKANGSMFGMDQIQGVNYEPTVTIQEYKALPVGMVSAYGGALEGSRIKGKGWILILPEQSNY